MKPRIIIYGPPGSGKDTLALGISDSIDIPVVSAGNLLRDEIERNTPLGKRVAPYVRRGELVPGSVVTDLMGLHVRRLEDSDSGYILVGYPRT